MSQIVDHVDLRRSIENRLTKLRQRPPKYVHLNVTDLTLQDGFWRAIVAPSKPGVRADDYAEPLAEIEEEILSELGLNVLFVPAADQ